MKSFNSGYGRGLDFAAGTGGSYDYSFTFGNGHGCGYLYGNAYGDSVVNNYQVDGVQSSEGFHTGNGHNLYPYQLIQFFLKT